MNNREPLYLDSGVVVNLFASGQMDGILQVLPYQCFIMDDIQQRSLLLWPDERLGQEQKPEQREKVQLPPLIDRGLLCVASFDIFQHCEAFVAFTRSLPDTQAKMLACALEKRAAIATDDLRVQRVIKADAPEVAIHTTLTLLQQWEEHQTIPLEMMQAAARRMRQYAFFYPEEDEPCYEWWSRLL